MVKRPIQALYFPNTATCLLTKHAHKSAHAIRSMSLYHITLTQICTVMYNNSPTDFVKLLSSEHSQLGAGEVHAPQSSRLMQDSH